MLFDHESDPGETNNLAGDPQYGKIRDELAKTLRAALPRERTP
jgi:hypothetical protein